MIERALPQLIARRIPCSEHELQLPPLNIISRTLASHTVVQTPREIGIWWLQLVPDFVFDGSEVETFDMYIRLLSLVGLHHVGLGPESLLCYTWSNTMSWQLESSSSLSPVNSDHQYVTTQESASGSYPWIWGTSSPC